MGKDYSLRPYQTRTLERQALALSEGVRVLLTVSPTGSGKTRMAIANIEPALARRWPCLFVAPYRQIVTQTSDKLDEMGMPDHGVTMAKHWRDRPDELLQVCSLGTLMSRLDKLRFTPRLIVLDEVHRATEDNSLGKLVKAFPDAFIFGYTATPIRLDGKPLGKIFQRMVISTTFNELLDEGYLKPPYYICGPPPDVSNVKRNGSGGDYQQEQLEAAMNKARIIGDAVKEWNRHAQSRPSIAFAAGLKHSANIVDAFSAKGIPAQHVDANTSEEDRKKYTRDLESGALKILSNVGVFCEGADFPFISCVIMLRPTKSLSKSIQMIGRGARPQEGVCNFVVIDHAGIVNEHGYITDDMNWTLDAEEQIVKPMKFQCPVCDAILKGRPPVCPACGTSLRGEAEPGGRNLMPVIDERIDLIEIGDPRKLKDRDAKARQEAYWQMEEKAFLDHDKAIWVWDAFKRRFGRYPTEADRAKSMNRIVVVTDDATGCRSPQWEHDAKRMAERQAKAAERKAARYA